MPALDEPPQGEARAEPVTVEDATVVYGDHTVLRVQGLEFRPGITGLVGLNGAGKTTLLTGMGSAGVRPAMRLRIGERPIRSRRDRESWSRRTALMPQVFEFPARFTVEQTLIYLGWLRGIHSRHVRRAVTQALEAVDLADRAQVKVGSLSGGMVRRLGLAQALVAEPELLLLDEPTAGLDPEQRLIFRRLLTALPQGRTTVISSHLMEDIVRVADHVLILHEGGIAFHGSLDEFWREARELGVSVDADPEVAFLSIARRGTR